MRVLKLCAVVALVLAFTGAAQANIQLNWIQNPGTQHIKFNILDWSMGTSYVIGPNDDNPTVGASNVDNLLQSTLPGGVGDEDFYSVVRVQEILVDTLSHPMEPTLWSHAADPDYEIYGLVYGGVDTYVQQDPNGQLVIGTDGQKVKFWIQKKGTADILPGSSGRGVTGDPEMYATIGFNADGTPTTDAELAIDGIIPSDKEIVDPTDPTITHYVGQRAYFVPDIDINGNPTGAGTGHGSFFIDIIGGTWQHFFAPGWPGLEMQDGYFDPGDPTWTPAQKAAWISPNPWPPHDPRHGYSESGDLHSENTVTPYDYNPSFPDADWILSSDDPTVGFMVVPEPLTIVSTFMALGTLGAYIRKRRTA